MKNYKKITAYLLAAAMTVTMPSSLWAAEADTSVFSDGQEIRQEQTDGSEQTDNTEQTDGSEQIDHADFTDNAETFYAGKEDTDGGNDDTEKETSDDPSDNLSEPETQAEVFTILTDSLEDGHVDKPYSAQLKSDSEAPVKWKLFGENYLPEGFTLSEDGVLSGTPGKMGYYYFGVQADNGEMTVYGEVSFQIRSREREQVPCRLEVLDEYDQARLNSDVDLGIVSEDRQGESRDVYLINTGTETLHPIQGVKEGTYFRYKITKQEVVAGYYLDVEVKPKKKLPGGVYEETITVNTKEGASCDINLKLIIGSASDKDYDLKFNFASNTIIFSKEDDYDEWPKGVFFTITGQKDTTVTVDASEMQHFELLDEDELNAVDPEKFSMKNLKPGERHDISIRPKEQYGVYDEILYLCLDDGSRYPVHIKQDCEKSENVEYLQVTAEKSKFPTKIWKYAAPPEALSMEVKNISQEDLTLYINKSGSKFRVSMPPVKVLKAGESISLKVQPETGLDVGSWGTRVNIMAQNSVGEIFSEYVYYEFEVSGFFFSGIVPGQLQTIKNVNGVPKTPEDLRLPEGIRLYGAEKETTFWVRVNWDLEHCTYQEDSKKAQKFEVAGELVFNDPEMNGDHLDTTVKIPVEVAAYKKLNAPLLEKTKVSENNVYATVIGLSAQAQGYQCVLVTDKKNLAKGKFVAEAKKEGMKEGNYLTLEYVQKGNYYLYCRGYKKNTGGSLEYGDWSAVQKVKVTEKTPKTPKIKKVEVKGCEVKITLDNPEKVGQYRATAARKKGKDGQPEKVEHIQRGYAGDSKVLFFTIPWKGTYYVCVNSTYGPFNDYSDYEGPRSRCSNLVKVTIKEGKTYQAPEIKKVSVSGRNVTVQFKNPKGITNSRWILADRVKFGRVRGLKYAKNTKDPGTVTLENIAPGTYYLVGKGYKKYYNNVYTLDSEIKKIVVK